jgi:hypothetical protein
VSRLIAATVLIVLLVAPLGCKRKRPAQAESALPSSGAPELASTVHLGDPRVADQLLKGFYDIEANAWRWTARSFEVMLRAPSGSGQLGARLQVHLTVPPVVIEKVGPVTLSAAISDTALPPETYSKPGDYVYERDVPGNLIRSTGVRVVFQLDKAVPPGTVEERELGVIVGSIGLALK